MKVFVMAVAGIQLLFACCYDYGSSRIPNALVFSMIGWGVLGEMVSAGWLGAVHYLGIVCLIWGVFFPLFCLRMLGAGDVKLLGATAGFLRDTEILPFCFGVFVAAALVSVCITLARRETGRRLCIFADYVRECVRSGRVLPYPSQGTRESGGICLSGPVLISFLLICIKGGYFEF